MTGKAASTASSYPLLRAIASNVGGFVDKFFRFRRHEPRDLSFPLRAVVQRTAARSDSRSTKRMTG
jgi:hypothetical protein